MKNKLIYFFRLRRQSDAVKVVCILVLAGMVCFVSAAYHILAIYGYINTPAEYVLTGNGMISEKNMNEMEQNKTVAKVSRQIECPVSVMYGGREASITCTLISKEYLEEMFQTDLSAGTKKIYMNKTAFSRLKEQWQENYQEIDLESGEGEAEFNIRYLLEGEANGEGEAAAVQYRSAKLIVVGNEGEEEEGAAYMAETENQLKKQSDSLRVQFMKHDLDGLQVGGLRKLGYAIQNEETVLMEEYELKIHLLHIRYGFLSCALCAVAVFSIRLKINQHRYTVKYVQMF